MCSAPYELWQPVQGCLELHITVAARARREDLNVLVVLRAMGCQSDAEALLHIGAEPAFEPLLAATLQDARQPGQPGHQRNTQAAALEWLGAPPGASPRRRSYVYIETWQDCVGGQAGELGTSRRLLRCYVPGVASAPRPAQARGRGSRAARAGSKVKQSGQSRGFGGGPRRAGGSARSKTDEARDLLANVVLCHIACPRYDFQDKARPPPRPYPIHTLRLPGEGAAFALILPCMRYGHQEMARPPQARPPRPRARALGPSALRAAAARLHVPPCVLGGMRPAPARSRVRAGDAQAWRAGLRAARPQERRGRLDRGGAQASGLPPGVTRATARARR